MKTAISIPDDIFDDAERLVSRLQMSRSELYTRAVAEFVARHDGDCVTEALNNTIDAVGSGDDLSGVIVNASRNTLQQVEW